MRKEEVINICHSAHGYVGVFVIVLDPIFVRGFVFLTPFGGYGFFGIYINEYNTATAMFVWVEFHGNSFLSFG